MLLNREKDEFLEEESAEEGLEWWLKSDAFDNVLLKQKSKGEPIIYETSAKSPTIMIWNDEDVDKIEIAEIESCSKRLITPEGNVKYRNYKVLPSTNMPLRMYSPSGDINMTPKKGKTIPKFEIDNSILQREKITLLISDDELYSKEMKAIVKPTGLNRQNLAALKRANESCLEEYVRFLNAIHFTPSPSLSMFSNDDDRYISPPMTPDVENFSRKLCKSTSVDKDDYFAKRPTFYRQMSVPNPGDNVRHMCLSDELNQADRYYLRSHTPKTMMSPDFAYFQRPVSSLSENFMPRRKQSESKKITLRNFVQRNMIEKANNRDKLAKLALAIEEDMEEDECEFITSAHLVKTRLNSMLEEIRILKDNLIEIQDEIQEDHERVDDLITQSKCLSEEFGIMRFLDNVIALLNNNLEEVVVKKNWPFYTPLNGRKRGTDVNLII